MSNIDDIISQLSINNINNSDWVNGLKEVNFAQNIIDTIHSVLELDDYESSILFPSIQNMVKNTGIYLMQMLLFWKMGKN